MKSKYSDQETHRRVTGAQLIHELNLAYKKQDLRRVYIAYSKLEMSTFKQNKQSKRNGLLSAYV